jgi:transcriptional antiterminator Rof (Rho-off)
MRPVQVSNYKPVSCDAHSSYELAVMQRTAALVRWQEGDAIREARLVPLDVETTNREEFLIAEDPDRKQLRIRLDRILSFTPE